MKKVLLTTVQKPFGIDNEHVMAELFHAQVTKVQGIFSLRSVYHGWGLEFIACNLKSPTTVLHYPSESRFRKEVRKGYDFVGIGFVAPTWYKAKRLIDITREESPGAKIVLGGYGTVLADVDRHADYVCRGEGLAFMQRLLGEKPGKPEEPYKTPIVVNTMSSISMPIGKTGVLFAGLGCPNGCDFCCTSHFFRKQHIPLLKTGKDIYEAMRRYDGVLPAPVYSIIDEDFLKDKKRVEELYRFTSLETDSPRSFACFSSVASIRQYDPEWLFELGVSTIWIGVESRLQRYEKTSGCDIKGLFDSLHDVGINTLGSMILGLDSHTPENIWQDIDCHISLRPSLSQFIIYSPCPTTPLWDRLDSEDRLYKDFPLEKRDGFHLLFRHRNFSAGQIERIQMEAFRKEFEELGPSALRYVEKTLQGYRRFSKSGKLIHVARRRAYHSLLSQSLILFGTAIRHAPSRKARDWAKDLEKEVRGELRFKDKVVWTAVSSIAPLFAAYTAFSLKHTMGHLQPRTVVNKYNFSGRVENRFTGGTEPNGLASPYQAARYRRSEQGASSGPI